MKTETEIKRELQEVRKLLAQDGSEDDDMLYGAQQALGWVLGDIRSPSQLAKVIQRVCDYFEEQEKHHEGNE